MILIKVISYLLRLLKFLANFELRRLFLKTKSMPLHQNVNSQNDSSSCCSDNTVSPQSRPPAIHPRSLSEGNLRRRKSQDSNRSRTPELRRRVSFADDHGQSLATIHMVNELQEQDLMVDNTELLRYVQAASEWAEQCRSGGSSTSTNGSTCPTSPQSPPVNPWHPNFVLSHKVSSELVLDVLDKGVLVHNAQLSPCNQFDCRLSGEINVKNTHFEKSVLLRWTIDDWKTQKDYKCFFANACGLFDVFRFDVFIPVTSQTEKLEFCAGFYSGSGAEMREYWANNGGRNYQFVKMDEPGAGGSSLMSDFNEMMFW